MEAELHGVLNTLTESNFQDAFKNDRSAGNCAYVQKGTTSKVMVASRHKVSFDEMVAPVSGIMECPSYLF
jgi:hypothetical protein